MSCTTKVKGALLSLHAKYFRTQLCDSGLELSLATEFFAVCIGVQTSCRLITTSFVQKVDRPGAHLAPAGIYVCTVYTCAYIYVRWEDY